MKPTPCIKPTELIAYENNRLSPNEKERVESHLKSCQDCFSELMNIRNVSRAVAYYYKSVPKGDNCYEPETWISYLDGKITGSERAKLKEHLADCDYCFDVVSSCIGRKIRQKEVKKWRLDDLMNQLKAKAERIRDEAKQMLIETGKWLQTMLHPTPLQHAYATARGTAIRTRGATRAAKELPVIHAEELNENGVLMGKTVPFTILFGPEIDSEQRFRLELYTPFEKYVGYTLDISLEKDNKRFNLCSMPLQPVEVKREKDKILTASATALVPLDETDVRIYEDTMYIPLDYIKLSIHPTL